MGKNKGILTSVITAFNKKPKSKNQKKKGKKKVKQKNISKKPKTIKKVKAKIIKRKTKKVNNFVTKPKWVTSNNHEKRISIDTSIRTSFDNVLNYVNSKGKVSSKITARELNLSEKEVIECAKILGEDGLIVVEYPIFGGLNLSKIGYKKEKKVK